MKVCSQAGKGWECRSSGRMWHRDVGADVSVSPPDSVKDHRDKPRQGDHGALGPMAAGDLRRPCSQPCRTPSHRRENNPLDCFLTLLIPTIRCCDSGGCPSGSCSESIEFHQRGGAMSGIEITRRDLTAGELRGPAGKIRDATGGAPDAGCGADVGLGGSDAGSRDLRNGPADLAG